MASMIRWWETWSKAAEGIRSLLMMMMMLRHIHRKESIPKTSNGQKTGNPHAWEPRRACLRATGGARSRPRRHSERSLAQRVTSGGTRARTQWKRKALRTIQYVFVSRASAKISRAHMKSHSASPTSPSVVCEWKPVRAIVSNASATQKSSAIAKQMTFNSASSCASLRLSVVTVGRSVLHECVPVTFPVLGLHEFATASRRGKQGWLVTRTSMSVSR